MNVSSLASLVLAVAAFVWLGMLLAISFMEAPLKFRAPNTTVPMCLSIGRVVFRALNRAEFVLVAVVVAALAVARPAIGVVAAFLIAFAMLATQVLAVRPKLNRRSDQVLAGLDAPRSRGHYAYVGLEVVKVAALATAGVLLLSGWTPAHYSDSRPETRADTETGGLNSMESTSLDALVTDKLAEAKQAHSGRAAHTIYGGGTKTLRQTLVALRGGQALAEHDSPGESTLQVLRGHVKLTAGDKAWEGKAGELVVIPETRHALEALEDSVILLTVAKRMP